MLPDQVSSIHGSLGPVYVSNASHFHGTWVPASFNYTNLAVTPVPLDVYLDQPSCYDYFCSTIYADYRPVLSVPQQVRSLDPAWANCDVFWQGVYDPSEALQPTDVEATSTVPGPYGSTTTAALPISPPASPTISPTALPVTTAAMSASLSSSGSSQGSTANMVAPISFISSAASVVAQTFYTSPTASGSSSVATGKASESQATSHGESVPLNTTVVVLSPADTTSQASTQLSASNALGVLTQAQQSKSYTKVSSVGPNSVNSGHLSQQYTSMQAFSNGIIASSTGNTGIVVQLTTESLDPILTSSEVLITADGSVYTTVEQASISAAIIQGSGGLVSVAPGSLIISGSVAPVSTTASLDPNQPGNPGSAAPTSKTEVKAILTVGSRTATALQVSSSGALQLLGTQLTVGGSAWTNGGQVFSAASGGVDEDESLVPWKSTVVPAAV
ncbi:hypothetical protein LTR62_008296 [Meristemomyces frigidus]|uniref:Uncharacterized protein n=1 Tax=Meristemomyces frigidus TaxID=1508187 RepID=A0AAN7YCR4_9PEZI|nr:hypothetical protein LTR62_008296 [Meristemomyces frigidus]